MNCGSVDSLKCSLRCGLRPEARQMRPIVEGLKPEARAIDRRLQCVGPRGSDSRVRTSTRSTASSDTLRGVPGRGSSSKPAQPAFQLLALALAELRDCAAMVIGHGARLLR